MVRERNHVGNAVQLSDATRQLQRCAMLFHYNGAGLARKAVQNRPHRPRETRRLVDDQCVAHRRRTPIRVGATDGKQQGSNGRSAEHVSNLVARAHCQQDVAHCVSKTFCDFARILT